MTRHSTLFLAFLLSLFALTGTGCEDDDPEIPNESELITNVNLIFTAPSGEVATYTFADVDGEGSTPPVSANTGTLAPNTEYQVSIILQDASDPADVEDITAEVLEEALEHQMFYQVSNGLNLSFTYDDMDTDGNPIGLRTTATTGASSSGMVTVTLRHEPAKDATGVAIDNPDAAGGETDVEVVYNLSF